MQPLPLAEIPVPKSASISWVRGAGWLITDVDRDCLTVLDDDLSHPVEMALPDLFGPFEASVSTDRELAAVVSMKGLTVVDAAGAVRWRKALNLIHQGHACAPRCLLTADGLCWLFLPDADELVVYDAMTGREVAGAPLSTDVGTATFHAHPDGTRVGLHVAMGQHGSLSYWARLIDGRVEIRDAPGECLADITADGRRYLAMPRLDGLICMRSVADGALLAEAEGEEIAGFAAPDGYIVTDEGALVSDALAIVGLEYDGQPDREQHVLLDTAILRWRATIDYGAQPVTNSIRSAGGGGRWLTVDADVSSATLWGLPTPS